MKMARYPSISREKIESLIIEDFSLQRRSNDLPRPVGGITLSKEWSGLPLEFNLLFNTISSANQTSATLKAEEYKKGVVGRWRQDLRKVSAIWDGVGLTLPQDLL
jgi:hypothetical protein